ncbi:MAG: bifunctional folylpolyglutamate synthase/dihydrofolate synthase [Deltaproteobacteria bacterium]|nr:MAG: bifunctional folylpolyglutamate synthase/dihydrofolate synthase [Deltaproteobacteria bacterium]
MKRNKVSYKEAVQYLYGLQKYGIKFGLSRTSNLLKAFGNPHRRQRYIHIAGSNGKGSVAAMVETILMKSGLKVAFYSSPHLVRFTERFRINGQEIAPDKAAAIAGELIDVIKPGHPPTFFEVTTAMALIYFAREKVDISIMEVGMGGRLDATNVIRPVVSVITNISLEHQFFLGSRLMDIAKEKAGIIKRGVDLVTAATQPSVVRLFESICEEKKASFWRVGKDVRYRSNGSSFNYYGLKRNFKGLELGLKGRFQNRNAALSLAVIEILERKGFEFSSHEVVGGLKDTTWPGRMHIVSRDPLIILDGAHNPKAIKELANSIKSGFSYRRLILVIGVMEDKDIGNIIRGILPIADYVIYTRPDYFRSASPEKLLREASSNTKQGEIVPVISEALEKAKEMVSPEDMILVCGSLFTVGEAMTYFDPEKYKPDQI